MRRLTILTAVVMTVATPVFAQVTVDLHALQALPEHPSAGHPAHAAPSMVTPNRPSVAAHQAPAASPAAPLAPLPAMPEGVPDTASIAPIAPPAPPPGAQPPAPPAGAQPPLPPPGAQSPASLAVAQSPAKPPGAQAPPPPAGAQQSPPPAGAQPAPLPAVAQSPAPPPGAQPAPPPPVPDKASTAATPTISGLRLTFAPGESSLSPDSSASIKQLTQAAPPGDATTFNVLAYAPGKPDDPSTARRISLSRAMAVRSALVADGVPSARIFVRALGEQYGDGPPDRVDLSVTGGTVATGSATSR
jgi:outer membrane protein OmpA-like peptidoglycan-associated protein